MASTTGTEPSANSAAEPGIATQDAPTTEVGEKGGAHEQQETTEPSGQTMSTTSPPPPPSADKIEASAGPHTPQPSEPPKSDPSQQPVTAPASGAAAAVMPSGSNVETEEDDNGATLLLTLLLGSGARHPFKIDGRYLQKRAVSVPDNDPYAMSVYTLKELILREWRSEWEPRPSSPSMIRLISLGKLLDDKAPLSDTRFNREAPNVVHMTVKPPEVAEEEDSKVAKSTHGRDREAGQSSPGCRCVIL